MADVDIVIVNYRSAAHLFNCVQSVHRVAKADGLNASIVVVNNGDDVDVKNVAASAGGATVVENVANLGFGVACNSGAACGNADLILFLNPDAMLEPGCLRICTSFLRDPAKASVGIVGPELHSEKGALIRSCSRLPSAFDLFGRAVGLHMLLPAASGYPFLPLAAHDASGPVGQVMGAAMMVRRALFQRLGGFDPRFFLYYEDVDFCARAARAGAACYYVKDAKAVHIGRVSSSRDSGMALALFLRSGLTYAELHFGRLAQAMLLIVTLFVEFPLRLVQAAMQAQSPATILRAYQLLLGDLVAGTSIVAAARRER
jgi:GT2 family glycosyltransferase